MHVCYAAEISESVKISVSDSLIPFICAKQLLRKMRGGSQSILVRGEDEELYVVKLNDNEQGPNLLANEMLGSELLRATGLPTPPWKAIFLSEEFLNCNPGLHFECKSGYKPIRSGLHFGSHFVMPKNGGAVYELLPSSFCRRISNPTDFLGIYIFDVWANHHDHRQALFSCDLMNPGVRANFVDNGHLFGSPHWCPKEKYGAAMHLDKNVYTVPWLDVSVDGWISHFETTIPQTLHRIVKQIPKDWYKGDISALTQYLEHRLLNLRKLFQHELQNNSRINPQQTTGLGNVPMQICDSRPLPVRSFVGRHPLPATT